MSTRATHTWMRSTARFATAAVLGSLFAGLIPDGAAAAPPANDSYLAPQVLTGAPVAVTGTTLDATTESQEPYHGNRPAHASIWYRWSAPTRGYYWIDTCGSGFDTTMSIYQASTRPLDEFPRYPNGNDQSDGPACAGSDQSEMAILASPTQDWLIVVDGADYGDAGTVSLNINRAPAPANDAFDDAEVLTGPTADLGGKNWNATVEDDEPLHFGDEGGASVWYSWTAPSSGLYRFDTCGSFFSTVIGLYTGSGLSGLVELASNGGGCDPWGSRVVFEAEAGTAYWLAIDGEFEGYAPDTGTYELLLRPASPPPNDDRADAHVISGSSFDDEYRPNIDATAEPADPAVFPGGASVWYRWTAPSDGTTTVNTCRSGYDTSLVVLRAGASSDGLVGASDDAEQCEEPGYFGSPGGFVSFHAQAGVTYEFMIDGYLGNENYHNFRLRHSPAPAAVPGPSGAPVTSPSTGQRAKALAKCKKVKPAKRKKCRSNAAKLPA